MNEYDICEGSAISINIVEARNLPSIPGVKNDFFVLFRCENNV